MCHQGLVEGNLPREHEGEEGVCAGWGGSGLAQKQPVHLGDIRASQGRKGERKIHLWPLCLAL